MSDTILKDIDKIETKQGFKKTKLGWIPDDWNTIKFQELCLGKGQYGINASAVKFDEHLPAYLRITDIDDDGYFSKKKKVSVNDVNYKNFTLKNGDIVFVRTGATVGKTYLYDPSDGELVYAGFLIKFTPDQTKLHNDYLKYYTQTESYWHWVSVTSVRSGQPGINGREYGNMYLPIAPLPEQKAIANCLSTWDDALVKLDQLITAKQQLKNALMQQLLNGKKRLPGFTGEWEKKRIDQLFDEIKEKNDGAEHEPLSISAGKGFKSQREKFDRVIAGTSLSKYIQLKKGDFSYNKGNSKSYKMGCIYLLEDYSTALVPFVFISFRPKNKVDSHFYKHYFINHGLDRQLKRIITSGARGDGLLNVSKKDFFKLLLPFPSIKEQTAISEVLNTADQEIELLKKQRKQLQVQKKGLMQQLLTGKKRLK